MKHIKSINEFRTIGFRYSEPTLGFLISCYYSGDIKEEDISDVLDNLNIKFDSIDITDEFGTLETEHGLIEVNGVISFNIIIYNEKEIEAILDEFGRLMYSVFETRTVNYQVKEHRENLKR
jgi:hypothetical protein